MKKTPKPHRVDTLSHTAHEMRDLLSISRNDHDDIVFHLDGGEEWQFTPCAKAKTPPVEKVRALDAKRGWVWVKQRTNLCGIWRIIKVASAPPVREVMLTKDEAAAYCGVSERTIREWTKSSNGDQPMLRGCAGRGRTLRIPRSSLDPYRKPPKA